MGIKAFVFQIDPNEDIDGIWEELETAGCLLLYSDSEQSIKKIFGHLPPGLQKKDALKHFHGILNIEAVQLPDIDWEAQWAAHENYREGFLHVDLGVYNPQIPLKTLQLVPGPGFGDLSHPTTRLVLKLMAPYVRQKQVVDVGCGSGILSLASIAMGAKEVCGIDIDEQALIHSKTNSQINGMGEQILFCFPEECKKIGKGAIMLINMIESEQKIACNSLASMFPYFSTAIASGILKEARDTYLALCSKWGWTLIQEEEEEGWLGFVFSFPESVQNL